MKKENFNVGSNATVPYLGAVKSSIKLSDLFIGIIARAPKATKERNETLNEWKLARKHNKANILLIEKGIRTSNIPPGTSIIEFDKGNPKAAIEKLITIHKTGSISILPHRLTVKSKMGQSSIKNTSQYYVQKNKLSRQQAATAAGVAAGMAIGLAAVSLAALISVLSSSPTSSSNK